MPESRQLAAQTPVEAKSQNLEGSEDKRHDHDDDQKRRNPELCDHGLALRALRETLRSRRITWAARSAWAIAWTAIIPSAWIAEAIAPSIAASQAKHAHHEHGCTKHFQRSLHMKLLKFKTSFSFAPFFDHDFFYSIFHAVKNVRIQINEGLCTNRYSPYETIIE